MGVKRRYNVGFWRGGDWGTKTHLTLVTETPSATIVRRPACKSAVDLRKDFVDTHTMSSACVEVIECARCRKKLDWCRLRDMTFRIEEENEH